MTLTKAKTVVDAVEAKLASLRNGHRVDVLRELTRVYDDSITVVFGNAGNLLAVFLGIPGMLRIESRSIRSVRLRLRKGLNPRHFCRVPFSSIVRSTFPGSSMALMVSVSGPSSRILETRETT